MGGRGDATRQRSSSNQFVANTTERAASGNWSARGRSVLRNQAETGSDVVVLDCATEDSVLGVSSHVPDQRRRSARRELSKRVNPDLHDASQNSSRGRLDEEVDLGNESDAIDGEVVVMPGTTTTREPGHGERIRSSIVSKKTTARKRSRESVDFPSRAKGPTPESSKRKANRDPRVAATENGSYGKTRRSGRDTSKANPREAVRNQALKGLSADRAKASERDYISYGRHGQDVEAARSSSAELTRALSRKSRQPVIDLIDEVPEQAVAEEKSLKVGSSDPEIRLDPAPTQSIFSACHREEVTDGSQPDEPLEDESYKGNLHELAGSRRPHTRSSRKNPVHEPETKSVFFDAKATRVSPESPQHIDPAPARDSAVEEAAAEADRIAKRDKEAIEQEKELERLGQTPCRVLFRYPPNESRGRVEVTTEDLARLHPGCYLNDSIVDFSVKYIERVWTPELLPESTPVFFFSSFFFGRLRRSSPIDYAGVQRWTNGAEDLFKKRFVFIPICDSHHWSLIIVTNLDVLAEYAERGESEWTGGALKRPTIIYLDSLNVQRGAEFSRVVQSYLLEEWLFRKERCGDPSSDVKPERLKEVKLVFQKVVKMLRPRAPRQKNEFDCGLYMLYSILTFLRDDDGFRARCVDRRFSRAGLTHLSKAYKESDVLELRETFREIFKQLTTEDVRLLIENDRVEKDERIKKFLEESASAKSKSSEVFGCVHPREKQLPSELVKNVLPGTKLEPESSSVVDSAADKNEVFTVDHESKCLNKLQAPNAGCERLEERGSGSEGLAGTVGAEAKRKEAVFECEENLQGELQSVERKSLSPRIPSLVAQSRSSSLALGTKNMRSVRAQPHTPDGNLALTLESPTFDMGDNADFTIPLTGQAPDEVVDKSASVAEAMATVREPSPQGVISPPQPTTPTLCILQGVVGARPGGMIVDTIGRPSDGTEIRLTDRSFGVEPHGLPSTHTEVCPLEFEPVEKLTSHIVPSTPGVEKSRTRRLDSDRALFEAEAHVGASTPTSMYVPMQTENERITSGPPDLTSDIVMLDGPERAESVSCMDEDEEDNGEMSDA